ncbi:hypothetical protein GGR57DRAFT_519001 [Xylariaceae sp. FL1272]|nr:hypothetical protein GGR57DRAFT_519001 [Xylariaceae sp. FL1272]
MTATLYGPGQGWLDAFDGYTFHVTAVSSADTSTIQKRQSLVSASGQQNVNLAFNNIIFSQTATDSSLTSTRVQTIDADFVGNIQYSLSANIDVTSARNTGRSTGVSTPGAGVGSGSLGPLTSFGDVVNFGLGTIQAALAIQVDASLTAAGQQTVATSAIIDVSQGAEVFIGFGNQAQLTNPRGFTITASSAFPADNVQTISDFGLTFNPTIALGVAIQGFGASSSGGVIFRTPQVSFSAVQTGCIDPFGQSKFGLTATTSVLGSAAIFGGLTPIEFAGTTVQGGDISELCI